MRELATYLRRHLWHLVLLAAVLAIFAGVFYLYRMPPEAVFYAALLTALPGGLLFLAGFLRYARRHQRLQSLLEQAENMEDIITIESAISETEQQIDDLSGTLQHYDALVDYAAVHLTLYEVYQLSDETQAPGGFGQRLGAAFTGGLRSFGDVLEGLVLAAAYGWVWLVLLAAAAAVAVRQVRRRRRRDAQDQHDNPPKL